MAGGATLAGAVGAGGRPPERGGKVTITICSVGAACCGGPAGACVVGGWASAASAVRVASGCVVAVASDGLETRPGADSAWVVLDAVADATATMSITNAARATLDIGSESNDDAVMTSGAAPLTTYAVNTALPRTATPALRVDQTR